MSLEAEILADADRCVQCGLCLPHCPTFNLARREAASPRGRINLLIGLARGDLEPTEVLQQHLEQCLGCLACEAMCPSEVPYRRLLARGRRLLAERGRPSRLPAEAQRLAEGTLPATTLRVWQRSGLQRLVRGSGLLGGRFGRLEALLPAKAGPGALPRLIPARGEEKGRVALFPGCTGNLFDSATLHATAALLARCGYAVATPARHLCCGGMYHAAGDQAAFERHARQTMGELLALEPDTIVYCATGCGLTLRDYPDWLGSDTGGWSGLLQEATAFIAAHLPPLELPSRPGRVAIHRPCSHRPPAHAGDIVDQLLARIPGLECVELGLKSCCGAAGSHMLSHPETADRLRAPAVEAARQSAAEFVVTTNVGCALHLSAGFREAGLKVEVLHPVTLLARQLEGTSGDEGRETASQGVR